MEKKNSLSGSLLVLKKVELPTIKVGLEKQQIIVKSWSRIKGVSAQ